MDDLKIKFNIGDWVILNEAYIEYIKKRFGIKSKSFINKNKYPQRIHAIHKGGSIPKSNILEFSRGNKAAITGTEFRLATEREIKEHEIRNIFMKK